MGNASREIEVKLPFPSAREAAGRLADLGARRTGERLFEENVLFERGHDPLEPQQKALRLRQVGGRSVLTFKGPVEGEHRHKVRVEHETEVADAVATERLLEALDYAPAWRYQKYRTEFELEGLAVCLDETPLGCFVELEGAPEAIDRVAARLDFSVADYVTDSYWDLAVEAADRRGERPKDLVFGTATE